MRCMYTTKVGRISWRNGGRVDRFLNVYRKTELRKVARQLQSIGPVPLSTTLPVIHEVSNFLSATREFLAFQQILDRLQIFVRESESVAPWQETINWMIRYQEHEPDFVDAHLVVLASVDRQVKVWTNDSEFKTIWRRNDGSAVPLAV